MTSSHQLKKALVVAPTYPYPIDGGNLVALHGYHLAIRAAGYTEVHFIGFEDETHQPGAQFEQTLLVAKPAKFTASGLLQHALGGSLLFARYWSDSFATKLRQLVQQHRYDVVLFQHGYMAQYITAIADMIPEHCLKVASSEVLESRAFLKKSQLASNWLAALALKRESRILDHAEAQAFNAFDLVTFFSDEDLTHYQAHGGTSRAEVINLGIEVDRYPVVERNKAEGDAHTTLAFFGAFSWFANTDALEYLLKDIWPVIASNLPMVRLKIAGRDIPTWAHEYASDRLEIVGRVDSISEFLQGVDIVLSPIRIGGGIRLKILESLAYGRPVISTRVGLEGLADQVIPFVYAADTPAEYIDAVKRLTLDEARLSELSETASNVVRSTYDARSLARLFQKAS